MTSGAPWSVKGIDPKTREIAKDLARRSGMTLGEWLTHVIAEDGGDAPTVGPPRKSADRPASENRAPRRAGEDIDRVLGALEDLSTRFEASVQEQADAKARFDQAVADLKADQARVAQRLRAAELGGAGDGKIETLKALEGALNKVAGHMAAGEGRQREAMAEMRRELGEEMSRVGDQLNRKVLEVENRSADAIAQVGAEVTRVATAVEQRLRRADDAQAEALEKLGAEIARITERLSDRIAASERRSAQSVEDVGQQVARMADSLHARQERSEAELVERMRQSEERTAKLLEEARESIDRRLLRGAPRTEAPTVPFPERWTATAALQAGRVGIRSEAEDPVEPEVAVEAAAAEPDLTVAEAEILAVDAEVVEKDGLEADTILEASYDGLTAEVAHDEPHPAAAAEPEPAAPFDLEAYGPILMADGSVPQQQDHEAMRAVAEAITFDSLEEDEEAEPETEASQNAEAFGQLTEGPHDWLRPASRDSITQAKAEAFGRASLYPDADEGAPSGMTFVDLGARRTKPSHAMRGALLAGVSTAFMGLAGAGYVILNPQILHGIGAPATRPIPVGPPSTSAPAPQAAVALATAPTPATAAPPQTPKADQDLETQYRDAAAKVDNQDPTGVGPLRTVANLGYAPAQRRLGVLYENGGAGVEKDPAEGRRWTVRAAANGDARGMHNLALDYYEGIGGPQSATVAAEWFQRAAELGVRDSQWNLARFFEAGIGVQRDLGSAYRWYLIAGRAGDSAAQARADSLKDKLTADQRGRAEALAQAFRPDPPAPPAPLIASLSGANAKQLSLAQRALAKLGYYRGPNDGAASQALGEAIQGYQRAQGLAANGQLSPELLQTFAHVAQ
jgi:localization factor PodJL